MLKVIDRSTDDVAVLALEGKLAGLEGRGVIQEKIRTVLQKKSDQVKNIVLDLARVTWIDSTGLGELISCLSSAKKNGGTLVLAQLQAPVQSLLKMTNLTQIFDTYDTVEEAVAALSQGA